MGNAVGDEDATRDELKLSWKLGGKVYFFVLLSYRDLNTTEAIARI
jgi:hypothetical protein